MTAAYHPRAARRRGRSESLGVWDSTAMAVGGMIGGGIFSVLGVAITLAGHLAFGCFVVGGILAALTAHSYAGLTERVGRSGGPFAALRDAGHPSLGGWLLWLLVYGYMVAMAVYSFTFGRYAAAAVGGNLWVARGASIAVVLGFLLVNLRGIRLSSLTEDLVVGTKVAVLGAIGVIGLVQFSAERLRPLVESGWGGLFLGAATVFFAYEGFELITYDRDDMDDPDRTTRRALGLSVAIVAAIYIGVTLGAQMLTSDRQIVAGREVAFVVVGRAALGPIGKWVAILGAVLATGSAINATLFSAARLLRDAGRAGDVPRALARERRGLPVTALVVISVAGTAMAMLPGIARVIVIGSAAFLGVYTLVNALELREGRRRRDRVIGGLGLVGCVGALACLVVQLVRDDTVGLVLLVGFALAILGARVLYVRRSPSSTTNGDASPQSTSRT
ncbi:MAG: APC family permease [Actinomycetes bacterium]